MSRLEGMRRLIFPRVELGRGWGRGDRAGGDGVAGRRGKGIRRSEGVVLSGLVAGRRGKGIRRSEGVVLSGLVAGFCQFGKKVLYGSHVCTV